MAATQVVPIRRNMTRDDALAAARALAPRLRERAEQSINLRRAPEETIAELKESGLLRLMQPRAHGGYELGWDVACEVIQILAAACGSQAWVYRVLVDHNWMIGTFPAEAQEDVWGADQDVQSSSSFAPIGKAVPVDGGYRFSGRHGFSSGIDHVDWIIAGGMIEGMREPHYFLLPRAEGEVVDDWYANGLEGSGSKTFVSKDIFVPTHRTMTMAAAANGTGPGTAVNTAPLFRVPRGTFTTSGFSALAVGMAQGMLATWLDYSARRRAEGKLSAAMESVQMAAGAAAAEIDTAELLYLTTIRENMHSIERGDPPSDEAMHRARRNYSYVGQLVLSAASRLFQAGGASLIMKGNMLERLHRDIIAGGQHMAVNWPKASANWGAALLIEHGAEIAAPAV